MPLDNNVMNGSWDACKMYVLQELRRINDHLDKMDEKLDGLRDKITMLQVKVAMIAAVAGFVVTIVVNLILRALSIK